jgi:hypothetical protein
VPRYSTIYLGAAKNVLRPLIGHACFEKSNTRGSNTFYFDAYKNFMLKAKHFCLHREGLEGLIHRNLMLCSSYLYQANVELKIQVPN